MFQQKQRAVLKELELHLLWSPSLQLQESFLCACTHLLQHSNKCSIDASGHLYQQCFHLWLTLLCVQISSCYSQQASKVQKNNDRSMFHIGLLPLAKATMQQVVKGWPVPSLWQAGASHFHTSKVIDGVINLNFPCMVFSTSFVQHFRGHFKTWFIQEIISCLLFVS